MTTQIVGVLHFSIAAAYYVLAFVFGTRFFLPRHQTTARIAAVFFFAGCAGHHLAFGIHSLDGTPVPFNAWHHVIPALMQVAGAPAFIWAIWPHIPKMLSPARQDAKTSLPEVVVDGETQIITQANDYALELLGYSEGELVGQPLDVLVPARSQAAHHHYTAGYMLDPQLRPMSSDRQIRIACKDGSEKTVWVGLAPIDMSQIAAAILYIEGAKTAQTINPPD